MQGRKKEYTTLGLLRVPCARCGRKPSYATWQICADRRLHRPMCADCDIALNRLVLEWASYPNVEELMAAYERMVYGRAKE